MELLLNLVNGRVGDSPFCRSCSSELDKSVLGYTRIHVAGLVYLFIYYF